MNHWIDIIHAAVTLDQGMSYFVPQEDSMERFWDAMVVMQSVCEQVVTSRAHQCHLTLWFVAAQGDAGAAVEGNEVC